MDKRTQLKMNEAARILEPITTADDYSDIYEELGGEAIDSLVMEATALHTNINMDYKLPMSTFTRVMRVMGNQRRKYGNPK